MKQEYSPERAAASCGRLAKLLQGNGEALEDLTVVVLCLDALYRAENGRFKDHFNVELLP